MTNRRLLSALITALTLAVGGYAVYGIEPASSGTVKRAAEIRLPAPSASYDGHRRAPLRAQPASTRHADVDLRFAPSDEGANDAEPARDPEAPQLLSGLPWWSGPSNACGDWNTCGWRLPSVWVQTDFNLWRRRTRHLPVLVTTDPNDGVLPDAAVLFGGESLGDNVRPGGRIRFGTWLECDESWAVEAGYLQLGNGQLRFAVDSTTTPTIARPFFNTSIDAQDALLVASPGASTGSLDIVSNSHVLGADVTWRRVWSDDGRLRLDLLMGYQMSRIDESLTIRSSTDLLPAPITTIDVTDHFATKNEFHGGHLGLELQRAWSNWSFSLLARVGLGNMRQIVEIRGEQTTTLPGPPVTSNTVDRGLLAQSTNSGTFKRSVFAVAPEIGAHAAWRLSDQLTFNAGYSLFLWNRVAQPGDQIDAALAVNPTQPPPPGDPQRPAFEFRDGDYLLHGLDLGLIYSY